MNLPVIGVIPLYDDEKDSLWMIPGYMTGIMEAGGIPVMLPLSDDRQILDQLISECDGLLLTGGHDVSPSLYKESPLKECGVCCEKRDTMESILFSMALKLDKPVLGICRGIQFINAALGGNLYQDLPTQHPSDLEHHQTPPYHIPAHNVTILTESPLYDLLGTKELAVNSYHHQAIKTLSPQLTAMAYAPDGLVEAIYMKDKKFVWALQWHPEFSYKSDPASRKIFEKFVSATRAAI